MNKVRNFPLLLSRLFICFFVSVLWPVSVFSQQLGGKITDEHGNPLPAVNVFLKNTTTGSTSGVDGKYRIQVNQGAHTVVFRILGYETVEHEVLVTGNKPLELNIMLREKSLELNEAVVYADRRDIANRVMREARSKRKYYLEALESFTCFTYRKVSLQKKYPPETRKDTIFSDEGEALLVTESTDTTSKIKTTVLREYYSKLYAKDNKLKEEILAENEYTARRPGSSINVTLGVESKGLNIAFLGRQWRDPYILFYDAASSQINFMNPLIHAPQISEQPLLSPLAPAAPLSYTYDFDGLHYDDGKKIFRILVNPVFPGDALFSGHVYIEDSTWALRGVDLSVNPRVLLFCKELQIRQDYVKLNDSVVVPSKTVFTYSIRDGKNTIFGNISLFYSRYEPNTPLSAKIFGNELSGYDPQAFDRDSSWWSDIRPVHLNNSETLFATNIDSLQKKYASREYIDSLDASYNDINIWSFLIRGVGIRNSFKQSEVYFLPLLAQINPVGIGGYRHQFGGYYNKRFSNDLLMETEGLINYGFNNKDLRGKGGIGLTYVPEKFVRTFIRFGDFYDMINDYASIESIFSRSNYVRTQTLSIAQRMEIINGLFGEITVGFSDQTPIKDMQIENWSNELFGNLNVPTDFSRYKKFELRLELKYRPGQKYIMKNKRKIILETDHPEFSLLYRKGIQGILGSEVDFDFLELGVRDEMQLGRWGSSAWSVMAGSFVNRKSLRLIEYRYFRGSDLYFFSDPLRSFQLLGTTLSSSSAYFRANYMHHFEGAILNKVPLFNLLRISLAGGGGILLMEENNFRHTELFAGIERVIRIRKQLFRLGVYAVTADDNLSSARITYKAGISFYNPFTRKWDY
jgi:hypothetical protein